jgi:hypothetical protein
LERQGTPASADLHAQPGRARRSGVLHSLSKSRFR